MWYSNSRVALPPKIRIISQSFRFSCVAITVVLISSACVVCIPSLTVTLLGNKMEVDAKDSLATLLKDSGYAAGFANEELEKLPLPIKKRVCALKALQLKSIEVFTYLFINQYRF